VHVIVIVVIIIIIIIIISVVTVAGICKLVSDGVFWHATMTPIDIYQADSAFHPFESVVNIDWCHG